MARRSRYSSLKTKRAQNRARKVVPSWARRSRPERRSVPGKNPLHRRITIYSPIRSPRQVTRGIVRQMVVVRPKVSPVVGVKQPGVNQKVGPAVKLVKTSLRNCRKRKDFKKTMMRKLAAQVAGGGVGSLRKWRRTLGRLNDSPVLHDC